MCVVAYFSDWANVIFNILQILKSCFPLFLTIDAMILKYRSANVNSKRQNAEPQYTSPTPNATPLMTKRGSDVTLNKHCPVSRTNSVPDSTPLVSNSPSLVSHSNLSYSKFPHNVQLPSIPSLNNQNSFDY
eukprot:Pgem_evm2s19628